MHSLFTVLALAGAGLAHPSLTTRDEKFAWGPCPEEYGKPTAPILCSNFIAPLDYTDSDSKETVTLQLIKVPALLGPSKGTIFLNFGGPGGSGEQDTPAMALYQQA